METNKSYRVRVFTGPTCVREVAARVNGYSGLLEGRAEAGTQDIYFTLQAADQTDAYVRAQDLLAYCGLKSLGQRLGVANGMQATQKA